MGREADAQPVAILKATDIRRTIEWYTAAGFELRGLNPPDMPTWCELARDGLAVQFLSGATPWDGKPAFTGCLYLYRQASTLCTKKFVTASTANRALRNVNGAHESWCCAIRTATGSRSPNPPPDAANAVTDRPRNPCSPFG
jgi:hypothetical protein